MNSLTGFPRKARENNLIKHKVRLTTDKPIAPKSQRKKGLKDREHEQDYASRRPNRRVTLRVCKSHSMHHEEICADVRAIYSITIPNEYPGSDMRNIPERAANRSGSTISFIRGTVKGREPSPHTAFRTSQGLFQYTVIPNGCRNASKSFQRLAEQVLRGAEEYSNAHVDDIIVFLRTWEDHV